MTYLKLMVCTATPAWDDVVVVRVVVTVIGILLVTVITTCVQILTGKPVQNFVDKNKLPGRI